MNETFKQIEENIKKRTMIEMITKFIDYKKQDVIEQSAALHDIEMFLKQNPSLDTFDEVYRQMIIKEKSFEVVQKFVKNILH